jgi:hypothetical protein
MKVFLWMVEIFYQKVNAEALGGRTGGLASLFSYMP